MRWLRRTTGIIPCAVMSDCAPAIQNGVRAAYSDLGSLAPKFYWCIFHVIRAFKKRAIFYVGARAEEDLKEFCHMVYGENDPAIALQRFYSKWPEASPSFVHYVRTQWYNNIVHWATVYRMVSQFGWKVPAN